MLLEIAETANLLPCSIMRQLTANPLHIASIFHRAQRSRLLDVGKRHESKPFCFFRIPSIGMVQIRAVSLLSSRESHRSTTPWLLNGSEYFAVNRSIVFIDPRSRGLTHGAHGAEGGGGVAGQWPNSGMRMQRVPKYSLHTKWARLHHHNRKRCSTSDIPQ